MTNSIDVLIKTRVCPFLRPIPAATLFDYGIYPSPFLSLLCKINPLRYARSCFFSPSLSIRIHNVVIGKDISISIASVRRSNELNIVSSALEKNIHISFETARSSLNRIEPIQLPAYIKVLQQLENNPFSVAAFDNTRSCYDSHRTCCTRRRRKYATDFFGAKFFLGGIVVWCERDFYASHTPAYSSLISCIRL